MASSENNQNGLIPMANVKTQRYGNSGGVLVPIPRDFSKPRDIIEGMVMTPHIWPQPDGNDWIVYKPVRKSEGDQNHD